MCGRLFTKSPKMGVSRYSCEINDCPRLLSIKATSTATLSATSRDEVNYLPLSVARADMKRLTLSHPVMYNVWAMSRQPGSITSAASQLLRTYKSGEEAVVDAQKWLDEEDGKEEDGVQLVRFEDDEYRRLLGKYCRKLYTVVMEDGLWKKSNVVWTQAVPQ